MSALSNRTSSGPWFSSAAAAIADTKSRSAVVSEVPAKTSNAATATLFLVSSSQGASTSAFEVLNDSGKQQFSSWDPRRMFFLINCSANAIAKTEIALAEQLIRKNIH